MSTALLKRLEALRGEGTALALRAMESGLDALAVQPLPSAAAVHRLHELLCWLRAYPPSAPVLQRVRRMLDAFERRPDLRRHAAALAGSGIAGTAIEFRFFWAQARWLAERWPAQLTLQRDDSKVAARIAAALPAMLSPVEAQALVELKPDGFAALDRLKPPGCTDASFLQARIAAMPGSSFGREAVSDGIDASYRLSPGPGTPSRTHAGYTTAPVVFRPSPPERRRPDLRAEMRRPPRRIRRLPLADAQALVDLARSAMVTRERSLEAFSFADARDAWWVDDGDGLAYALIGVQPQRRHALATWVGGLTLRNGVPIGYLQSDHVGRSAALSFNTFETFRGGEAAHTFARWLAALHATYGACAFSIEPYQLGLHNDEALHSGAWWFYAKLGFAPRDAALLALASRERERIARQPSRRSTPRTLQRLASRHLFFDLDPARPHPLIPLGELGLQAGALLSQRFGCDREAGQATLARELLQRCGASPARWARGDALGALQRLAPLLAVLDTADWAAADWQALGAVLQAKAARREVDFVRAWLAHPRLDATLHRWAAASDP